MIQFNAFDPCHVDCTVGHLVQEISEKCQSAQASADAVMANICGSYAELDGVDLVESPKVRSL